MAERVIVQRPTKGGYFTDRDFEQRRNEGKFPVAVRLANGKTGYVLMDMGQSHDYSVNGKLPDGLK